MENTMTTEHEQDLRERLKDLKQFYTNLVTYGAVFCSTVIIWMITGGPFWPIWVLFGLGLSALMQALRLGMVPVLGDIFPFLKPDWEEEQLQKLVDKQEPKIRSRGKKESADA
jgi:hypothetical protein